MIDDDTSAVDRIEQLGRRGFTVSVCCGPCGALPFAWSVHILNAAGDEFDGPFLARDFAHAIEIADIEITARRPQ